MASGANPQAVNLPPGVLGRLSWQEGGQAHERTVGSDGLTIGRSSQNGLAVTDLAASRFHCKVLPEGGGLALVDLDSTNGTYLNEVRLSGSQALKDGDQIRIGQQVFHVQVAPPPPPPAPAQPAAPHVMALPLEETYVVPAEQNVPLLVISSSAGRGTTFALKKSRMQIGRASRNEQWDIDLVDKSVSRPHAEILHQGDEWLVKDLGSANGVLLNNKRVKDIAPLKDGDVLEFGETVMIFRSAMS